MNATSHTLSTCWSENISAFTDTRSLKRYALYVFDYAAPTGFRLAMARLERVTAIVSQNGKAYEKDWESRGPPSDATGENPPS
jgi:hypothetical protein